VRLLWCCLSGMAAPYNDVKRLTLERAWVLMDHTFVCNGQLYKQVDGMGSPLAPALADIFMNHAGPASYSRSDVVQASRSMYETVKLTVMEPLHPHTIKGALAKLKIANRTFQRRRWIAEPEILDPAKLQQFISTHMNMPPQHYAPSLDSPPQQILPLSRFSPSADSPPQQILARLLLGLPLLSNYEVTPSKQYTMAPEGCGTCQKKEPSKRESF